VTEVEEGCGSAADAACNTKTKLVEAKLEMVRAAELFHCGASVSSVHWINTRDCLQRDEIDRRLQGGIGRAKADPAVIQALGSPIRDGFPVSGNTNVTGASGESNLAIPISGPKGKGTIYVSANKSLGQWNYLRRVVEVGQTHQRIDLLHTSTPASHPDFLRCKSRQKNFP
jgi:Cytochrome oxidase complex assembly protein 1